METIYQNIGPDVKEMFDGFQSEETSLPHFKPKKSNQFHAELPEFSSDRLVKLVDETDKMRNFPHRA